MLKSEKLKLDLWKTKKMKHNFPKKRFCKFLLCIRKMQLWRLRRKVCQKSKNSKLENRKNQKRSHFQTKTLLLKISAVHLIYMFVKINNLTFSRSHSNVKAKVMSFSKISFRPNLCIKSQKTVSTTQLKLFVKSEMFFVDSKKIQVIFFSKTDPQLVPCIRRTQFWHSFPENFAKTPELIIRNFTKTWISSFGERRQIVPLR